MRRLDRGIDKRTTELRELERAQDGTAINTPRTELLTHRARATSATSATPSSMRDAVAEQYRA